MSTAQARLFSQCVRTCVALEELDIIFGDGGEGTISEKRTWTKAAELLREAKQAGESMPVFFGDARHNVMGLYYWAVLTDIKTPDEGGTTYSFKDLRRLPNQPAQDLLTVVSTGKPLSMNHQRPYVICHTPSSGSRLRSEMEQSVAPEADVPF